MKLRKELANDPFMANCIYEDCPGRPEWEHAFVYSGRQVNERWAIVPCCRFHHRGPGLDKEYNKWCAVKRLFQSAEEYVKEQIKKYPKVDWVQIHRYLRRKYMVTNTG